MEPTSELIELIAADAAGELDQPGLDRLNAICTRDTEARVLRMHLESLLAAGTTDDTVDAPGSVLHRAYQIAANAISGSVQETGKVSLLEIIFDSLRPVAGLRSTGTARRQLMLEFGDISVDIFVDHVASRCVVTAMVEGAESPELELIAESASAVSMTKAAGEWRATVKPGTYTFRIEAEDQRLESEPFEIV